MPDARKIVLNAAVVGAVLLAAATQPVPGQSVVVVAPTWFGNPGALAVIAKADGAIVGGETSAAIAVGFSDDPAFVTRLYGAGALLVWNAALLLACSSKS
jgi:hypothetical protein